MIALGPLLAVVEFVPFKQPAKNALHTPFILPLFSIKLRVSPAASRLVPSVAQALDPGRAHSHAITMSERFLLYFRALMAAFIVCCIGVQLHLLSRGLVCRSVRVCCL